MVNEIEKIKLDLKVSEMCKTLKEYLQKKYTSIIKIKVEYDPEKKYMPPASVYSDGGYTIDEIRFRCEYQKEVDILGSKRIINDKCYLSKLDVKKIYGELLSDDGYELNSIYNSFLENGIISVRGVKKDIIFNNQPIEKPIEVIDRSLIDYLFEMKEITEKKFSKGLKLLRGLRGL